MNDVVESRTCRSVISTPRPTLEDALTFGLPGSEYWRIGRRHHMMRNRRGSAFISDHSEGKSAIRSLKAFSTELLTRPPPLVLPTSNLPIGAATLFAHGLCLSSETPKAAAITAGSTQQVNYTSFAVLVLVI